MTKMPAVSDETIARARRRSSATLHEAAGKSGALPPAIKPLSPDVCVCGRAYPVSSPSGDNLWLHHAIYAADRNEVLVIDVGEDPEFGYWGEIMTVAAQVRGLSGVVMNGGVRDGRRILAMNFPVFAHSTCIRGTGKDPLGKGSLGAPITLGRVTIVRGDLVFGDGDGVVVLPAASAAAIVEEGERRDAAEDEIFGRLRSGATTLAVYGLPALPAAPVPV